MNIIMSPLRNVLLGIFCSFSPSLNVAFSSTRFMCMSNAFSTPVTTMPFFSLTDTCSPNSSPNTSSGFISYSLKKIFFLMLLILRIKYIKNRFLRVF